MFLMDTTFEIVYARRDIVIFIFLNRSYIALCLSVTTTFRSTMASSTTASQTELKAAQVPLAWRDQCSACGFQFEFNPKRLTPHHWSLFIPLNTYRRKTAYMPWECTDERHGYEKWVLSLFNIGPLPLRFLTRISVNMTSTFIHCSYRWWCLLPVQLDASDEKDVED